MPVLGKMVIEQQQALSCYFFKLVKVNITKYPWIFLLVHAIVGGSDSRLK
jgi:hypothetical protein